MGEFVNWATLGTYGGALSMVLILTQLTKDVGVVKKIPTQIWSYILSTVVLMCSMAFTEGLTVEITAQTLFNAVIVSIAANGGFSAYKRLTNKEDPANE